MATDSLRYVAMGPGWSGDTDDMERAEAWLQANNGNGAIYIRRDLVASVTPEPVCAAVNELCDIVSSLAIGTVHMIGGDSAGEIADRLQVVKQLVGMAAPTVANAARTRKEG